MTELAIKIAQLLTVVSVTSEIDQQSTNSIAQQALETANIALTTAQQAISSIPQIRTSAEPLAVTAGDSTLNITWTPPMPDTFYAVLGTYYGPNTAVATFYNFRVVDGSRTVNGCQIRFDNTPANTKWSYLVQQI